MALFHRILRGTAIGGFVVYLAWNFVWLFQGNVPPSLFQTLTGWPAPTTGGTRSFHYLLAGDWSESLRYNAMTIPVILLLAASGASFGRSMAWSAATSVAHVAGLELGRRARHRLGRQAIWGPWILVSRMPLIRIETIDDPRLALYRDLKSPAAKQRSERFVVEGQLLAERLLLSGLGVESVLVEERLAEAWAALVPADTPLLVIPRGWVRELIGFRFHRGVLACGLRPPSRDLRQLVQSAGDTSAWVACVSVQDPENLGGIMRSSAAFGVHALLLGPECADPFCAASHGLRWAPTFACR